MCIMRSPCRMLTFCSVTYVTYHDCIHNRVRCPLSTHSSLYYTDLVWWRWLTLTVPRRGPVWDVFSSMVGWLPVTSTEGLTPPSGSRSLQPSGEALAANTHCTAGRHSPGKRMRTSRLLAVCSGIRLAVSRVLLSVIRLSEHPGRVAENWIGYQ